MQVILKQDIEKLGKIGDVVKVARGYARNYLLPKKLAIPANEVNMRVVEQMHQASAKRDLKEKANAELVSAEISKLTLKVTRKAGEGGSLFGSVTSMDVAELLASHKIEIDKRKVILEDPIKSIGEFTIPIRLHSEVTTQVKLNVNPEAE